MRPSGQERRSVHDAQGRVARGDESGFFNQLTFRTFERSLVVIEGSCRHLPGGLVPGMTPLADQDGIAVLKVRDDKSRVGIRQHRIDGLGPVRKPDDVFTQGERTGAPGDHGGHDRERPALVVVRKFFCYFSLPISVAPPRPPRPRPRRRVADRGHSRRATSRLTASWPARPDPDGLR